MSCCVHWTETDSQFPFSEYIECLRDWSINDFRPSTTRPELDPFAEPGLEERDEEDGVGTPKMWVSSEESAQSRAYVSYEIDLEKIN